MGKHSKKAAAEMAAKYTAHGVVIRKLTSNIGEVLELSRGASNALVTEKDLVISKTLFGTLAQAGLPVSGTKAQGEVLACINAALAGPSSGETRVLLRPGITGKDYAFPTGEIDSESPVGFVRCSFKREESSVTGKIKKANQMLQWTIENPIPMLFVAATFSSLLVRYSTLEANPILGVHGCHQKGKTAVLRMCASFLADPRSSDVPFTAQEVEDNLERALSRANDSVLFLDAADGKSFGGTPRVASSAQKRMLSAISDGRASRAGERARYVGLSTSNSPITELLGNLPANQVQNIQDSYISVPTSVAGTFECEEPGFETSTDLAREINRFSAHNHGLLFPKYVHAFMKWMRDVGEAGVEAFVDDVMREFYDLAAPGTKGGGNHRVVDAFGLFWAGGRKGHELGLLPIEFADHKYVLECYKRHLSMDAGGPSAMEQLKKVAAGHDVVHLGCRERYTGPTNDLDHTPVIRTNRNGEQELLLNAKAMAFFFKFPLAIVSDPDVITIMVRDGAHNAVHRPVTGTSGERYHAFKIDLSDHT